MIQSARNRAQSSLRCHLSGIAEVVYGEFVGRAAGVAIVRGDASGAGIFLALAQAQPATLGRGSAPQARSNRADWFRAARSVHVFLNAIHSLRCDSGLCREISGPHAVVGGVAMIFSSPSVQFELARTPVAGWLSPALPTDRQTAIGFGG